MDFPASDWSGPNGLEWPWGNEPRSEPSESFGRKKERSSSSDVERSIISGAVIKRKLDKTDADKANEARRAQLLDFLNDSRGETG